MSKSISIKGWPTIRRKILDRDGYLCRICHSDGGGNPLEVHHIDYSRANNKDENLVTLCRDHHKAVHMERYKPSEHEDWPVPWGNNKVQFEEF